MRSDAKRFEILYEGNKTVQEKLSPSGGMNCDADSAAGEIRCDS